MGMNAIFDPHVWAAVPFHFWSVMFFALGTIVGSFLNVCIYRMPLGFSVVSPPSFCPHCRYSIPFYLNMPLVTWVVLGGRCKNCKAAISLRYFMVEMLTGLLFLWVWQVFGHKAPALAPAYWLLLSGLLVATFIDLEYFIIPDEITLGGILAGLVVSIILPGLHHTSARMEGFRLAMLGALVGGGVVYGILRLGKLLFGRQKMVFPPGSRVLFTETALHLPDREIGYEDLFYRQTDTIHFHAHSLELADRGYKNVLVRLSSSKLQIGDESLKPEDVPFLDAECSEIILPREAMGLGDVKFMAAIGAFTGWQGALFSLMLSSMIGASVGVALILMRRREWSSRIPYGPYIAIASLVWVFWGRMILGFLFPS